MERTLIILGLVLIGALVGLQPAMNAVVGRATAVLAAAFVSFAMGTLFLGLILLISGQSKPLIGVLDVPWFYLMAGVVGAIWVVASLMAVARIGAGGVVAATVAGQLTGALLADRFGVLGLQAIGLTSGRIAGAVLLTAGVYLIVN